MISVSVVIPAYNEELRLPATLKALQCFAERVSSGISITEVLVIDDGSTDRTAEVVGDFQKQWSQLRLFSLRSNSGKGAAIHVGLAQATSPWVLVADADMSTPWEELHKLLQGCEEHFLIMGSRGLPESDVQVRQHWFRQGLGKSFNRILRALVGIPFKDTQCGFKLIRNDHLFRSQILSHLHVQRFAWDVELILICQQHGQSVREVPVRWLHQEESRVRIFRDSCEMLWTVLKLKNRFRKA